MPIYAEITGPDIFNVLHFISDHIHSTGRNNYKKQCIKRMAVQ